jgi:hypothetical protein
MPVMIALGSFAMENTWMPGNLVGSLSACRLQALFGRQTKFSEGVEGLGAGPVLAVDLLQSCQQGMPKPCFFNGSADAVGRQLTRSIAQ